MGNVQSENARAHGQILIPAAKLHLSAGQGVVTIHDGRVERRHEGRVEEIEQVRDRRAKPLDALRVNLPDGREHLLFSGATYASVEELSEGSLIEGILVDVWNAQLRLPEKRVVSALEDLALLRDRMYDGF